MPAGFQEEYIINNKITMLKNQISSDSLQANSFTQQPQLHYWYGETFSMWKEVGEICNFCWSKKELITSSKLRGVLEQAWQKGFGCRLNISFYPVTIFI